VSVDRQTGISEFKSPYRAFSTVLPEKVTKL
jgi:hypothetical protein